jgi:tetratricopeptide (TPR) repeat protein
VPAEAALQKVRGTQGDSPFGQGGNMTRALFAALTAACLMQTVFASDTVTKSSSVLNYQAPSTSDLEVLKAAVKDNPNDCIAHSKLGNWYLHASQPDTAINEYKKAIRLDKTYAIAWNNLGSAYYAKNKYKDAAKYYRKATELQPNLAVAHRNLGSVLMTMGRLEPSLEAFRNALKLDPAILEAMPDVTVATPRPNTLTHYYYFAKLCASMGQVDSAIDFLRKAQAKGFADFQRVKNDPDFKDVIADARFDIMTRGF